MMISIGNKHFIESKYIVEILKAADTRAVGMQDIATESGRLINAAGGKRIRSVIKLKSKHIVLSALGAETLRSRLGNLSLSEAPGDRAELNKKRHARKLRPSEFIEQRMEPDRRRFSYTHHIPERRSGGERRSSDRCR